MAGRGVDIKIDDEVRELGGLYVLGTERHEARRIDNQLRGRSGRQGDPGETRFYLSGRDDLVRLFAGDRIHGIMERFKLPDDQPMEAGILSRQIENAQKKVEEQNFVARKNVLKYDDVMNVQRQVIYEQRNSVLHGADLSEEIREEWLPEVISNVVSDYTAAELSEDWELGDLVAAMDTLYGTGVAAEELKGLERDQIVQEFLDDALDAYAEREKEIEALEEGLMRQLERFIILQVVDTRWREHLENMDYMREGIGLRGLAQKDPLVEYRNEGAMMFQDLNRAIREEVITLLFHAEVSAQESAELQQQAAERRATATLSYEHQSLAGSEAILAAGGTSTAAAGFASAGGVATPVAPRPKVNSELRERGPERPLPVRLRQEVQEVPRRLSRPEPALADDAIWLEPLAEALVARARLGARRRRGHRPVHAHPVRARTAQFLTTWLGRYERALGRRLLPPGSRCATARPARRSASPALVQLDLEKQEGGDRLRRRSGSPRARHRRARGRPAHPLGLRDPRPAAHRAAASIPRTSRRRGSRSVRATASKARSATCTSRRGGGATSPSGRAWPTTDLVGCRA